MALSVKTAAAAVKTYGATVFLQASLIAGNVIKGSAASSPSPRGPAAKATAKLQ